MKILKKIFTLFSLILVSSTFVACTESILKIPTPVRDDVVRIHVMSHHMADSLLQINENWALAEGRHEDYKNLQAALETLQSSPTLDISAVETALDTSKEVEAEYKIDISLSLEERREIEAELAADYVDLAAVTFDICALYCRVIDRIAHERDDFSKAIMTAQVLTTSHILLLTPDIYEALENPVVYGIIERSGDTEEEMGESTKEMIESLKEMESKASAASDEVK